MFCKNCGKEIEDNSNFCIYCGADLTEKPSTFDQQCQSQQGQQYQQEQQWQNQQGQQPQIENQGKINAFGIAGFVVSLLSLWLGVYFCIASIIGVVFGGVGVSKSKECTSCNGLAVAGLVIGIISLVFWGMIWMFVGTALNI